MKLYHAPLMTGLVAAGALMAGAGLPASAQETTELRWGTSAVGSSGHRALVAFANVLNEQMPEFDVTVQPMPGAIATVRGFATGQIDAYYGASIAFSEFANDSGRFEGFQDQAENELLQSFWAYSIEVGIGVDGDDRDQYSGWGDLEGQPVFTGPAPWDTRAQLERVLETVNAGHEYIELDLGLAGSALEEGQIEAFKIYTAGEATAAPWVIEAMMTTDVAILNPSEEVQQTLTDAGFELTTVPASTFGAEVEGEEAILVPFFYGFHVGNNLSEQQVYDMLVTIEENVDALVEGDPAFSQLQDDMVAMQTRGITASVDDVRIHPGLARFMRERDAWNEEWDDRVAEGG